jgi:DNA-binding transcriptional LysR family regulator
VIVELRHLKGFLAVARHGHFTRAAGELGVAQPALSQQIAQLEEELGVVVFERSRRGARLTAAGQSLVSRAERILLEVDEARREAGRYASLDHGRVVIGTISSIAVLRLPALLARFRAHHPGVEVEVREGYVARLVQLLGSGVLDVAVIHTGSLRTVGVAPPPGRGGTQVTWETAYSEELVLIVSRRHRLARAREARWIDLSDEAFVMFHEGSMVRSIVGAAAAVAGFSVRIALEVDETATLRSFVAAGLGVSVLPRSMAASPGPPVDLVRLAVPRLFRTVRLGWRRQAEANPAAVALLDLLRSQLVRRGQP